MTIQAEKVAAGRIIGRALAKGYLVSVCDGEEYTVKRSTNRAKIVAALATTDSDTVLIRKPDGTRVGAIWFIWGNSPEEVAADYTDNAEIREVVGD
jgi:hypothetical protein